MRLLKIILITVVALFTIVTITYSARIFVINKLAIKPLGLYQINVSCLDISLASNMTIIVDKLCLDSTKANIEIVDTAIQWQFQPKFTITQVDVKRASVTGTGHIFSNVSPEPNEKNIPINNSNISQVLSVTFRPFIKQLNQFALPIKITVPEIVYLPFSENKHLKKSLPNQQGLTYLASVLAEENKLYFSLKNSDEKEFMSLKLDKSNQAAGFTILFSSNLNSLKTFVSAHQLPITAELQRTFNAHEISGLIDTQINYQTNMIGIKNRLSTIAFISEQGIGGSGPLKLIADLNVETQLPITANKTQTSRKPGTIDSAVALTFVGKNSASLEFSQPDILAMLEPSSLPPKIRSIIDDNPISKLTLNLKDNTKLRMNHEALNLSDIEMKAFGLKQIHYAKLENMALSYTDNSLLDMDGKNTVEKHLNNRGVKAKEVDEKITIERFLIDSQVKITDLNKYTTEPVTFHLEGSLEKIKKQSKLTLNQGSAITANHIFFTKPQLNSVAKPVVSTLKKKVQLSLQALSLQLEGYIQQRTEHGLTVNLKTQSQATRVHIPKTIQINSFDLMSDIKGSLDHLDINTSVRADGVDLGNIFVKGSVQRPQVEVVATKLRLTDLFSLNFKLPINIELIDGLLDYNISGQLIDLNKLENNPLNISVGVTSVSGEVDGVWLQELNWQQNFTALKGNIATLPNVANNLTVALIEMPTPVSNVSMNTQGTFNKSFTLSASQLKAELLGGTLSVPTIEWPFEQGHSASVHLNSIDLAQVFALDKKEGIVVTGNISGQLPIAFDGEKYRIKQGALYNINDGLIQVKDNPAVAELKANNAQLQLAFDALQNLHYHQLSSAVSMADDGYMLLETVIKGRNPDIDNDVNLNLNLSYDLLGLLESMSITQRFEENIIKGLQKNKE